MLNGGVVKASAPWHRDKNKIGIRGIFSGIGWSPGTRIVVTHYRDYRNLGSWIVAGTGHLSGVATDSLLVLASETPTSKLSGKTPFLPNDILVIGDGTYTELLFDKSDLELTADDRVEIGRERLRAVALLSQAPNAYSPVTPTRAIVFHKPNIKLPQGTAVIWWREKCYQASFSLPDTYIDSKLRTFGEKIKSLSKEMHWAVMDVLEAQLDSMLSGLSQEESPKPI